MNAVSPSLHDKDESLVDIRNLVVRFGNTGPARVKGISLDIRRGECLAFVGESGSGKSVTARTIIGQSGSGAQVSAEAVRFDGRDVLSLTEREWGKIRGQRIGFVMQDALGSLDPLRTIGHEVGETLRLHSRLGRRERTEKVIDLLRSVGVPEPELRILQRPGQLSGGQRQRALIASAIACDPELLIADEPTTALDAIVQAQVLRLLQGLRSPHRSMLVVSHDFAVVAQLADRIAVFQEGLIVEEGPAARILSSPVHPYTRALLKGARELHGGGQTVVALRPAAPAGQPIIEGRDLVKRFDGPNGSRRTAVGGVSFALNAGETLGIVGESGSGKTTLTRLVLGLETPDEGEVVLRGRNWNDLRAEEKRVERKHIQVVFQDPLASFDPRYTVGRVLEEAIAVAGTGRGVARAQRAKELLRLVQLDTALLSRRPIELSGGQRQRVAIARALAPDPRVLVCDEPVSALDIYVQAQILDLLIDLRQRLGLSCIFISHDLGVIKRISDRVLVMKEGHIVEQGLVDKVFASPAHAYTRALIDAVLPIEANRKVEHA